MTDEYQQFHPCKNVFGNLYAICGRRWKRLVVVGFISLPIKQFNAENGFKFRKHRIHMHNTSRPYTFACHLSAIVIVKDNPRPSVSVLKPDPGFDAGCWVYRVQEQVPHTMTPVR